MRTLTGTFDAPGEASVALSLEPGDSIRIVLTTAALTGSVALERAGKGLGFWDRIASYTDSVETTYQNLTGKVEQVRLRCIDLEVDPGAEEVDYLLEEAAGDELEVVRSPGGRVLATFRDDGTAAVPGHIGISSVEQLRTNGDAAVAIGLDTYQTVLTTGGSEGSEDAEIGDGTGAIVGQRKLITLGTITAEGDEVALDDTNISQGSDTITAVALTVAADFILLEWQGATWEVIAAAADVVTTA